MRKILSAALCVVLVLSLSIPALAVEPPVEIETAANALARQGIILGDQNGNMHLDSGLTRAELAVLLTRLHGEGTVNPEHYTWACYFTDVPAWAKGYVGYCTAMRLVSGYGGEQFGADDAVVPAAACTVVLRACGYDDGEGSAWNYSTASDYAVELGLISESTAQAAEITRGEMAVLIYRALNGPAEQPAQQATLQADAITIADDGIITSKVITQTDWSREDFSQQANPEIFTGYYTRGWYNAIRQSIVDRDIILAGNGEDGLNPRYLYAHTLVPDNPIEVFDAFSHILGRIHGLNYYYLSAESYTQNQYEYPGYTIIKVMPGWSKTETLSFIQPELDLLSGKNDREKVAQLNRYLCGLMEYDEDETAIEDYIFSPHKEPVRGECSSYATAFSFLCDAAGIPCILVSSTTHSWNEVYVDGMWLTVDVSSNDASGGPNQDNYLMKDRVPGIDRNPAGTQFAKELLVPGSTK